MGAPPKVIDWVKIRAEYVMRGDMPSFDTLCAEHHISKPLIIQKAGDRNDELNNGKTWIEARDIFHHKNEAEMQDAVIANSRKYVDTYMKMINNLGVKAFKLLDKDLDRLLVLQEQDKDFQIKKHIRLGDFAKLADSMYRLTGAGASKELVINLPGVRSLRDLTDSELKDARRQMLGGAPAVDPDREIMVDEDSGKE